MNVVIQVAPCDSAKAWSLLVRHSPGTALLNDVFIVSEEAVRALCQADVDYTLITQYATARSIP